MNSDKKSKTIAIDIRALMHGNVSGVEVYILNFLQELFRIDTKNTYILYYNSYTDVMKHIPQFQHPNVQYVSTRIPNKLFNIFLSLFRYPKLDKLIQRKTGKKIDCFFIPDPRPAPVSNICKKIMNIHDLSCIRFKNCFSLKTRIWHKLLRLKKELSECYQILTVSNFTKSEVLKEFPFCSDKVKTMYPCINTEFKQVSNQEKLAQVRKKYNLPERFFLTLSTLEPRKNLKRLISAYTHWNNDDIKLVVAGRTNSMIFAKIPEVKNAADIYFSGFIEEEDKAALYSLAEAFIYISLYEGFGYPLVEAKKCSIPIITSNLASMPEVAGERGVVLVDPYNEEEIVNSFNKVLRMKKNDCGDVEFDNERSVVEWPACPCQRQVEVGRLNG